MTFQPIPDELLARATPAERKAYAAALKRHIALSSPMDFALTVRPEAEDYPHTRYISDAITDIPDWGGLIIIMGPRQGKSYLCSEATPAWALSRDPSARVLHATYGHDFMASKIAPVVHGLIRQNQPITPPMHPKRRAITDFMIDPKVGNGFYFGTGVDGPMTGMPADWLILDDLIKNATDAKSQVLRDNVWRWYVQVAEQRLEPMGKTIVVGTPWHEDDILSRLIANYKDDPRWRIIHLPSIAEEDDPLGREPGEALCPARFPLEELERKKKLDPIGFAAMHQGRPTPADGDVFKEQNLLLYSRERLPERGLKFGILDTAHSLKRTADYTVLTLFLASAPPNPKLYVTHMFRDKVESGRHIAWVDERIATLAPDERPLWIGVEDKTFGSTLLSTARIQGRQGKVMFRPIPAVGDKVERAQPAATLSTQGQLLFPDDVPWLADAKHELLLFPNATHDDIVDTIAYGGQVFASTPHRTPPKQEMVRIDNSPTARMIRYRERQKQEARKAKNRQRKSIFT